MTLEQKKLEILYAIDETQQSDLLIETAGRVLQNPVMAVDCMLKPLFPSGSPEHCQKLAPYMVMLKKVPINRYSSEGSVQLLDAEGHRWMSIPIHLKNVLVGYCVVCEAETPFNDESFPLIQTVCRAAALQTAASVQFLWDSTEFSLSRRLMFDDLLESQIPRSESLEARLALIDWDAVQGLYVISVHLWEGNRLMTIPVLIDRLCAQIGDQLPVYTYTYHFNQLVILLKFGDMPHPHIHYETYDKLRELFDNFGLKAGISCCYNDVRLTHEAFSQAGMAVEMAEKLELAGSFTTYESIALYHMIQISTARVRDPNIFIHRAMTLLKEYDEKHGSSLLYTLFVYLNESKNTGKAADILCIHKNTLNYRIQKIKDLTQIDLDRGEEVLHLQFSFMFLKYMGIDISQETEQG